MKLYVISDRRLAPPGRWLRRLALAAQAGAAIIQIREKDLPDGERFETLRRAVALCRPHGAKVLINGRPDMAKLAGADGVQLGAKTLPVREARKLLGKKALIERLPDQPGDVPVTFADVSKASRFLGYDPQVPIEEGIRRFVKWLKGE